VSQPLALSPAAEDDLHAAAAWYDAQQPGPDDAFLRSVDACFTRIARSPRSFPADPYDIRTALLRRFPYVVLFRVHEERIDVGALGYAVARLPEWVTQTATYYLTGTLPELYEAATLDPRTHRYLIHAGRAALQTGDRATATRVAEVGVARFVGEPEEAAYHLLLVNAMSARDPRTAVSHVVRCLEVWPGRPDCQRALRSLLEDAPDAATNRAVLDAILAVRPDLRAAIGE